jgi:hypothetical protein
MSEEDFVGKKNRFVVAVARGESIPKWAAANGVGKSTAYKWNKRPEIRVAVLDCRRRLIDRAAGLLSGRAPWAAAGIIELAKGAESESVQLAARRAILKEMIVVTDFGDLEYRVKQLEEKARADETSATPMP